MLSPDLIDAFAAGLYLLFFIIHLDLWLKRRDRSSHLWLAGAAAGALLVDLTGMALRGVEPGSGGPVLPILNLSGAVLVTVSLFELVLTLGNERSGRFMHALYAAMAALVIAAGIRLIRNPAMIAVLLTSMAVLLAALVRAARGGRAGDREARAIATGLVVLIVSLVADILRTVNMLPVPPAMPILGFATLFLVSASALNGRYEREHGELVELQRELEQRVADRTRDLEDANQRLEEASRTDSLTGLPNRRAFLEVSDHELKRSLRAGAPFSVVMVDLDHFKEINDRHGHAGGDDLLQAAASRLRSVLRAEDLVARWGGEEFILLLPDTDADAAAVAAEKARAVLAACEFRRDGAREAITASFGVAAHREARSLEATIAAADAALYRAKEAGRNRVVVGG